MIPYLLKGFDNTDTESTLLGTYSIHTVMNILLVEKSNKWRRERSKAKSPAAEA